MLGGFNCWICLNLCHNLFEGWQLDNWQTFLQTNHSLVFRSCLMRETPEQCPDLIIETAGKSCLPLYWDLRSFALLSHHYESELQISQVIHTNTVHCPHHSYKSLTFNFVIFASSSEIFHFCAFMKISASWAEDDDGGGHSPL